MKFYIVTREEYNGFDCNGHFVDYIVAADNEMDAINTLMIDKVKDFDISNFNITIDPKDGWVTWSDITGDTWIDEKVYYVRELNLPDINTIKTSTVIR
jgi:hypothetical protein